MLEKLALVAPAVAFVLAYTSRPITGSPVPADYATEAGVSAGLSPAAARTRLERQLP